MTDESFPRLKRFEVTVSGYGAGVYVTTTRGKAMADAWRCDAFGHLTFGEFLKRARCVRTHFIATMMRAASLRARIPTPAGGA